MKKKRFTEVQIAYARRRSRRAKRKRRSAVARRDRADVLPVKEEVRLDGRGGGAQAEAAR